MLVFANQIIADPVLYQSNSKQRFWFCWDTYLLMFLQPRSRKLSTSSTTASRYGVTSSRMAWPCSRVPSTTASRTSRERRRLRTGSRNWTCSRTLPLWRSTPRNHRSLFGEWLLLGYVRLVLRSLFGDWLLLGYVSLVLRSRSGEWLLLCYIPNINIIIIYCFTNVAGA